MYLKNNGSSPLIEAGKIGNIGIVKELVENGADINIKDNNGVTPLKLATDYKKLEIAEHLKNNGAK